MARFGAGRQGVLVMASRQAGAGLTFLVVAGLVVAGLVGLAGAGSLAAVLVDTPDRVAGVVPVQAGPEGDDEEMGNPFAGRVVTSTREALDILLEEMGLGSIISFQAVSEPDAETVVLEGVVLADPDDPLLRLEIGRVVIGDLDLEGLGTPGGPSRFRLALEAIDYGSLAEGLRSTLGVPLPVLDDASTLTLAFSLLPAAMGDGRMTGTFLGQLDRQIGLSFEVTASPPPGAATVDPFATEEIFVDAFVFELADWGFLAASMREQAAAEGQSQEVFIAEGLEEMRLALEPMAPGSPAAAVFDAVSAMLADLDRPGVLRFSLLSDEARPLEVLFEALAVAETLDADGLTFAITYLPME